MLPSSETEHARSVS